MAKQPKQLSDQLREAVRNSEFSCYAICKATGIDKAAISKFLSGERGLSWANADKLAEFLNLELRKKSKGR